jgi:hypothetical protein
LWLTGDDPETSGWLQSLTTVHWEVALRGKRSRAFEAAYSEAETGWVTPSLLDDFLTDGAPQ